MFPFSTFAAGMDPKEVNRFSSSLRHPCCCCGKAELNSLQEESFDSFHSCSIEAVREIETD